jgi:hypothetical protein
MNKTHHFHKYEKAVDSHKLTPPFREDEWQIFESLKLKRRAAIIPSDLDITTVKVDDDIEVMEKKKLETMKANCWTYMFFVSAPSTALLRESSLESSQESTSAKL